MRTNHTALASFVLSSLAVLILGSLSCAFSADADKDKDKPKEKPFKYDVWCAFSDLMADRPYVSPNAPIDPDSDHVHPNLENLGGFGRRGQWVHAIVDLKNTTDPADKIVYSGTSTIVLNHIKPSDSSQYAYSTTYRQSFKIAPQTEKPYHFSVFAPEHGWNEALNVDINISNGSPRSRRFSLRNLDARNEQLIVVVSDHPGAFKYLGPQKKNLDFNTDTDTLPDNAAQQPQGDRQVATVTPSELPVRWHDLALASLIIIDGPPAGGLSAEQWDALKTYAQSGGKILIMAGKDPNRLKGPVEELAGIRVRGTTELPRLDTFGDTEADKFPAKILWTPEFRVPVIDVTAPPSIGIVRTQKTSDQAVVEYCAKSYGAGTVAFIPFSLSDRKFEGWGPRFDIPLTLIRPERNLFSVDPNDDTPTPQTNKFGYPYNNGYDPNANNRTAIGKTDLSAMRNALDTSFEYDTPVEIQSPKTVLWFMIIYLACAVPLNYVIFFYLKRREAAWLMAPVWALTFTVAAIQVGYSGHTGVITANEVSVIEAGSKQDSGVGRTFMGIYTPRQADYQIEFPPLENGYDPQAAPGHLVNTKTMEERDHTFPSMEIREEGQKLRIERVLIHERSTCRFEIQHRAWLGGGLELTYGAPDMQNGRNPRIHVHNGVQRLVQKAALSERGEVDAVIVNPDDKRLIDDMPFRRKAIEDGIVVFDDEQRVVVETGKDRIEIPRKRVLTIRTVEIGRTLYNPLFIKDGKYLELAASAKQNALGFNETIDVNVSSNDWHSLDEKIVKQGDKPAEKWQMAEKFIARFSQDGRSEHAAVRAEAVANFLKDHTKQYAGGVFIAWADGASLPVTLGPAGYELQKPNLDGFTLLVVPVDASNRNGRGISYKMAPPKLFSSNAYSPDLSGSGKWERVEKAPAQIKISESKSTRCVYLRLEFDREFGRYIYENKAAQLSFNVTHRGGGNSPPFVGEVNVLSRFDAATTKAERFKEQKVVAISSLTPGRSQRVVLDKFQFNNADLFTQSSIILKVQVQSDEGNLLPENLTLDGIELKLVDR